MSVSSNEALSDLLGKLGALRLAVVGDVMLDRFVMGEVDRISPEAPVPVVHVRGEEERLGGAANVAANVAALGAGTTLFGVVGPGEAGDHLADRLQARGIDATGLVRCEERVTTIKTRIVAGTQQVVRIDRETKGPLTVATRARLLDAIETRGPFAAVVVSDYGKGVVGSELMDRMRAWHRAGQVVVVDPKQGSFELYREVTCLTPNEREAAGALHATIAGEDDAVRVGWDLKRRVRSELLLLTRGEHGMTLFEGEDRTTQLPTEASHVFDVTGAGDTVIACFTTFLAAKASPVMAARLANVAAGLVVRELGTAVVGTQALAQAYARRNGPSPG
jgi:rfaE bifunctional protein kinase chain/domain